MCNDSGAKTFLITSDGIGPEPELSTILMRTFLAELAASPGHAALILLINRGVLLAAQGAETVEELKKLEEAGVAVYSCGTCLDFFKIKDKVAAGGVGNMASTVGALTGHGDVVTIG